VQCADDKGMADACFVAQRSNFEGFLIDKISRNNTALF
jgi:hypothetical protein